MRATSPLLVALALALPLSAARADDPPALDALVERIAPSIVTVKYVTKVGESESEGEFSAATLDATGLVVLGNGRLPGTPRSVKVLYGTDPTEHDAVLVARDTALGLAWVQPLDEPKAADKKPATLDLGKSSALRVGTPLFGIARSGRAFDFAPTLERAYVAAKIEKPRSMWALAGSFTSVGLPVFDLSGAVAGVLARQGVEDDEEMGSGECSCDGSADRAACTDDHGTFILTLEDVRRSLEQAKKRVPEAIAKAKQAKDAEKPEGATPAATGKEGGTPATEPAPAPAPAPAPKPKDPPGR
jgi:hypothetical protein